MKQDDETSGIWKAPGQTDPSAGAASEWLYVFPHLGTHVKNRIFFTGLCLTEKNDMSLISIPWPDSEPEATMMASLLYLYGIPFFIHGAKLARVRPAMQASGHNRFVLVPEETADFTIAVLSNVMCAESGGGRLDDT